MAKAKLIEADDMSAFCCGDDTVSTGLEPEESDEPDGVATARELPADQNSAQFNPLTDTQTKTANTVASANKTAKVLAFPTRSAKVAPAALAVAA